MAVSPEQCSVTIFIIFLSAVLMVIAPACYRELSGFLGHPVLAPEEGGPLEVKTPLPLPSP